MEQKTRAFIALNFPDEVIKEISRIYPLILKNKFVGKLTELENLHLTLKFLGEISQETLSLVQQKLSQIEFSSFNASLLNMGTFSYRKSPRIVWIKVGGKPIHDLQKQIDLVLSTEFKKEQRFMSHLTLARIKHISDKSQFVEKINNIKVKNIKFQVNSFKLMSSDLKPLGPVYKTIKEFSLD